MFPLWHGDGETKKPVLQDCHKSCLCNFPYIVLVRLFELAVMFCTGDNRDILIIGLLLESIVLNMIL